MATNKIARGRGNQGDWASSQSKCKPLPLHMKEHNAKIEAKRQAKLAKRKDKS